MQLYLQKHEAAREELGALKTLWTMEVNQRATYFCAGLRQNQGEAAKSYIVITCTVVTINIAFLTCVPPSLASLADWWTIIISQETVTVNYPIGLFSC